MRNRTKKEEKLINDQIMLFLIVIAFAGWYFTRTIEGTVITVIIGIAVLMLFAVWRSFRYKKRMQQSGISDIDQMTGRQFEEYVGTLFASQGYNVTYTPATGDFGADLILKKGQDVIVIQAKRYKNSVGITAVQEVIPAVKMYNATAAWVISNSYYTKAAVKLAVSNQVRMIDRDQLIRMSIDMKNKASISANKTG